MRVVVTSLSASKLKLFLKALVWVVENIKNLHNSCGYVKQCVQAAKSTMYEHLNILLAVPQTFSCFYR